MTDQRSTRHYIARRDPFLQSVTITSIMLARNTVRVDTGLPPARAPFVGLTHGPASHRARQAVVSATSGTARLRGPKRTAR